VGNNGVPQSRAGGLTRAILDTFPIVKFGTQPTTSAAMDLNKDPESIMGMNNLQSTDHDSVPREAPVSVPATTGPHDGPDATATHSTATEPTTENAKASERSLPGGEHVLPVADVGEGPSSDPSPKVSRHDDVVPASIGREICPICIVEFEEGDDIRVLPCEGKHSFHQKCVDPWLLKLSSSCPICRHGGLSLLLCQMHPSQFVTIRFPRAGKYAFWPSGCRGG
jgi:Ring finger domain